jgi:hypothetical protein
MNPQDIKVLIDKLKKINKNLETTFMGQSLICEEIHQMVKLLVNLSNAHENSKSTQ